MMGSTHRLSRWVLPIVIISSAASLTILTLLNDSSPARVILAFWFLSFCPGMAFVGMLNLKDFVSQVALSIALSFALDILVSELVAYSGHWSFQNGLFILDALTLVGVGLQIVVNSRVPVESFNIPESNVDHQ
jgi:hypothetical protein